MLLAQRAWPRTTYHVICNWILPLGYLCLLSGLFLLPGRSQYHQLFYVLVATPALIALMLEPTHFKRLFREPVLLAFLLFTAWALLSLVWSLGEESPGSLIKRPFFIFLLFAATTLIALHNRLRLEQSMAAAAVLAVPFALYGLVLFAQDWTPDSRLVGSGALDNPLLSSHLYGFFCVAWLGFAMTRPHKQALLAVLPLVVLGATLLATGSRTPLVATSMAAAWLVLACWNRRAAWLAVIGAASIGALLLWFPESLLSRGTSYRLDIWQFVLGKVAQYPLLGHGLDAPLEVPVAALNMVFSEPHSFALGVVYYTGVIGLVLWLAMFVLGLVTCWRQRQDGLFVIAGALLVYGLGAGLTEGGAIFTRPKEHWFLVWIPLALIAALSIANRYRKEPQA